MAPCVAVPVVAHGLLPLCAEPTGTKLFHVAHEFTTAGPEAVFSFVQVALHDDRVGHGPGLVLYWKYQPGSFTPAWQLETAPPPAQVGVPEALTTACVVSTSEQFPRPVKAHPGKPGTSVNRFWSNVRALDQSAAGSVENVFCETPRPPYDQIP